MRGMACYAGPCGESTRVGQEQMKEQKESIDHRLHWGFHGKDKAGLVSQFRIG